MVPHFLFVLWLCGGCLWSNPANGLQLGIRTNGAIITVELKNIGNKPITAYSHVETYERHYDWFSFRVYAKEAEVSGVNKSFIPILLVSDREQSAPVHVSLKPGDAITHSINLFDWMNRKVNQNLKLSGEFQIQAVYKNDPCTDCNDFYKSIWVGTLESPAVPLSLKKLESIKLKVRVTHHLPVGWGDKYKGNVEKVVEGDTKEFGNEIDFGRAASEIEFLKVGDVRIITFQNTGQMNPEPFLPPISGTVSRILELWYIAKIEKPE